MRTYIDVTINPNSAGPSEVVHAMMKLGIKPIFGAHDFYIDWTTEEEFKSKFKEVHRVLQSLNISYRLQTYEFPQEEARSIAVLSRKRER
ncbi:MAG: hypothetical protein QW379_03660 [Thermoplasmata archaeon]